MIGLAGQLGDGLVLRWWNDAFVPRVAIRIERRLLPIPHRDLLPQGFRALATTVPNVEG